MMNPERWFAGQLALLSKLPWRFEFDDSGCSWVRVLDFDLPKRVYVDKYTNLLLLIPFPNIENASGYSFYTNRFLARYDNARFHHIFDNAGYNDLHGQGYARLSFHLNSFRPTADIISGDNLVDLLEAVYHFLAQKKGVI